MKYQKFKIFFFSAIFFVSVTLSSVSARNFRLVVLLQWVSWPEFSLDTYKLSVDDAYVYLNGEILPWISPDMVPSDEIIKLDLDTYVWSNRNEKELSASVFRAYYNHPKRSISYRILDNIVLYAEPDLIIVPWADPKSFVGINRHLWKDKNLVFNGLRAIPWADPESFSHLHDRYWSDNDSLFYISQETYNLLLDETFSWAKEHFSTGLILVQNINWNNTLFCKDKTIVTDFNLDFFSIISWSNFIYQDHAYIDCKKDESYRSEKASTEDTPWYKKLRKWIIQIFWN